MRLWGRKRGRHGRHPAGDTDPVEERLARIEAENQDLRDGQADLVAALEVMTGVPAPRPGADPGEIRQEFILASADSRPQTVRFELDGQEVIAGTDGTGGDPRAWVQAIRRVAG